MIKPHHKKIAIFGCAGSGKTTLALQLKKILPLPIVHLDKHYWKPNWEMPNFPEFYDIHFDLCEQEKWIMEGMYFRALYPRISHADVVIFLDMPRYLCIWRVLKRLVSNYGKTHESRNNNCPEQFDMEFMKFVWQFNKRFRRSILSMINEHRSEKSIHILRSPKEVNDFIKMLPIDDKT